VVTTDGGDLDEYIKRKAEKVIMDTALKELKHRVEA